MFPCLKLSFNLVLYVFLKSSRPNDIALANDFPPFLIVILLMLVASKNLVNGIVVLAITSQSKLIIFAEGSNISGIRINRMQAQRVLNSGLSRSMISLE